VFAELEGCDPALAAAVKDYEARLQDEITATFMNNPIRPHCLQIV
jgi:hypothetical protein